MTIWISRELPLFNFERLGILCAWIWSPSEKLWQFEFLKSSRCSISSVSIYYARESDLRVKCYDHLNLLRASVVNFERPDELCHRIGHPCEKLWPFEFVESFCCLISSARYVMRLNRTSELKVMAIWISRELPLLNFVRLDILCAWIGHPIEKLWQFEFLESFRCSISSVSIYNAPESGP